MARCVIGPKKLKRLRKRFPGLDIEKAWVRGNTEHRVDLCLTDGRIASYWPKTNEVELSDARWKLA